MSRLQVVVRPRQHQLAGHNHAGVIVARIHLMGGDHVGDDIGEQQRHGRRRDRLDLSGLFSPIHSGTATSPSWSGNKRTVVVTGA